MVTTPVLRQLMSDRLSLLEYYDGELPRFDAVLRRLMLLERKLDTRFPDHHYRRSRDLVLEGVETLPQLLTDGLLRLAEAHLEFSGGRVWVKDDAFEDWMECLTFCAPLPLAAALIWKERFTPGEKDPARLGAFAREHLAPNLRHTCLQSPRFPHLEAIKDNGGFHDLHIHLSGSIETDRAWLHFLRNPLAVAKEVEKGCRKSEIVREQWEQELPLPDGEGMMLRLLLIARRIRFGMVERLFPPPDEQNPAGSLRGVGIREFLRAKSRADYKIPQTRAHPLGRRIFSAGTGNGTASDELCLEALLHVLAIDSLTLSPDSFLAHCYHCYLLILGFVNSFLVQQVHQFGFDQFQKITLNEFREVPEKKYAERFCQMQGNKLDVLGHIEGRFAPKITVKKTLRLLENIRNGWEQAEALREKEEKKPARLSLVSHFIKERDAQKLTPSRQRLVRHGKFRKKVQRQAWALISAWNSYGRLKKLMVGADAASNELEAPPEVFAPVFRRLRRRQIPHFTYHAGEDFHHLLGGLRAICEAVDFCGLGKGDRIGHATGAGIDPRLWFRHAGDSLIVSQGEWLDDLIFLCSLMINEASPELTHRHSGIVARIEELSKEVYGKVYCEAELREAWKLRRYCPYHLLAETRTEVPSILWDEYEWRQCRRLSLADGVSELVYLYHQSGCRINYHKKIRLKEVDRFTADELCCVQKLVLQRLHQKEIVLETLPSSNIRISFYRNTSEHHLWRWLKVAEDSPFQAVPPVVVGTDDTGIFATNIYNEYGRIYCELIKGFGLGQEEAARVVERLEQNSRVYKFRANVNS